MTRLNALCPYKLTNVVRANAGSEVQAELPEVASGDGERGPTRCVYLDWRGFARIDGFPAAARPGFRIGYSGGRGRPDLRLVRASRRGAGGRSGTLPRVAGKSRAPC